MEVVTENVSLLVVFGGGLVSFLSPCVLPMVPVYLAVLHGPEVFGGKGTRLPAFLHSLGFVLGFSVVFIVLGAIFGLTGYAVNPDYPLLRKVAGGLLMAFGLFLLAATQVPWLNFEQRLAPALGGRAGYLRSFAIGGAFSLGWSACIGPILGGILTLAATKATAWQGAYLLGVFSLGLGFPFLAVGAAFDSVRPVLRRVQKYSGVIHIISGLLLVAVGILMLSGKVNWFSSLVG
jgi:cytochrome c-type biogenesis protein